MSYRIRIGLSYLARLPDFVGRDPALTTNAILAFSFESRERALDVADHVNAARLGNNKAYVEPIPPVRNVRTTSPAAPLRHNHE